MPTRPPPRIPIRPLPGIRPRIFQPRVKPRLFTPRIRPVVPQGVMPKISLTARPFSKMLPGFPRKIEEKQKKHKGIKLNIWIG